MRKIIPYILIALVLVGFFSPVQNAQAQGTPSCWNTITGEAVPGLNQGQCVDTAGDVWQVSSPGASTPPPSGTASTAPAGPTSGSAVQTDNVLEKNLPQCGVIFSGNLEGCLVKFSYYVFFALPAFILGVIATMFNAMLALTLSSNLYSASSFIPEAWKIIRDISNIFFILVLLYISIKIILGLGGHEVKKMIGSVIIMALLINFSMFFTEVVIDSANILALIFYNKIDVKGPNGVDRPYSPVFHSTVPEKDFSGAIVQAFNPTALMKQEMFQTQQGPLINTPDPARGDKCFATFPDLRGGVAATGLPHEQEVPCYGPPVQASTSLFLGIIFVSFAVFALASYALVVSGVSFLARLIELWVLIIFSPFAFMSYSVPILGGISSIGWEEWSKKLLKTSFMAPIFMLLLYLISRIAQLNIFKDVTNSNNGTIASILLIVIPAMIYMVLLLQATKFAKEGSGAVGDLIWKGAKMAGGLGLAAATGGAGLAIGASAAGLGMAGRRAIGSRGAALATKYAGDDSLSGKAFQRIGKFASTSSFDVRGSKLVTAALGKAGISKGLTAMSEVQKGGYVQARKDQVEKRKKRALELEVGEDEPLKKTLKTYEEALQKLLNDNAHALHDFDQRIKDERQELADAHQSGDKTKIDAASDKLQSTLKDKKDLRDSTGITSLEKTMLPGVKGAIEDENRRRKWAYATKIEKRSGISKFFSSGIEDPNVAREASHAIRMESKPENSGDSGSHH